MEFRNVHSLQCSLLFGFPDVAIVNLVVTENGRRPIIRIVFGAELRTRMRVSEFYLVNFVGRQIARFQYILEKLFGILLMLQPNDDPFEFVCDGSDSSNINITIHHRCFYFTS